ncbi:MAG: IS110 family transposase [Dyadobacter sp. 50-39]|uniref:IS110 family transposase n=1 Tax=Dyadobacter sp. 50-39 TaxID=1895756 RepID=UPI0009664FF1|nr:IS110 family transposase [Dyadobacter sp. 50-39]OJV13932.1 MAG: IS110 family transposase [Dyadobacter sp. 50-39]
MAVVEFPQLIARGCGLDVHKDTVVASIRGTGIQEETRTFATFTRDLEGLSLWLEGHQITHIAMESTGVYWRPVYYVLEGHFEIILVNARHIKNVPGHKTDKKDSEWIAKLLLSGLLRHSFVPEGWVRELRTLLRHRKKLVNERSREKNRLQNILEDANIKLGSVVSDVFSKTGQGIIDLLLEGVTDPVVLSNQAKGSLVNKKQALQQALYGRFCERHRFMLKLLTQTMCALDKLIAQLDQQIELCLNGKLDQLALLQTIPGVSRQSAIGIISEIGIDMSQFTSDKHLASWAGVCPGNNESAGKVRSARTTHGNTYLKTTLIEASWAASHTINTYLSFKYHKLTQRRGKKKAAMAIAHHILTASYHILRDKLPYKEPAMRAEILIERRKAEILRLENRVRKLKILASQ